MITIPKETGDAGFAEAVQNANDAIANNLTAVIFVFGDNPNALQIVRDAASVKPQLRQVVSVPNPDVLPADLKNLWDGSAVAVAVSRAGNPVQQLSGSKAKQDIFVENAYLKAEEEA